MSVVAGDVEDDFEYRQPYLLMRSCVASKGEEREGAVRVLLYHACTRGGYCYCWACMRVLLSSAASGKVAVDRASSRRRNARNVYRI